ncbi:hypothetical protein OKW30_000189 [Paraburkholderia sp. Clong3]
MDCVWLRHSLLTYSLQWRGELMVGERSGAAIQGRPAYWVDWGVPHCNRCGGDHAKTGFGTLEIGRIVDVAVRAVSRLLELSQFGRQ